MKGASPTAPSCISGQFASPAITADQLLPRPGLQVTQHIVASPQAGAAPELPGKSIELQEPRAATLPAGC